MFQKIYNKKRVFVTGHTGFKGSWLLLWLRNLGAEVFGYALPPDTDPNHYQLIGWPVSTVRSDIRHFKKLSAAINRATPEIVFHLAAQALVKPSFENPIKTFQTNIMGTAHLLEVCRRTPSVRAVIIVTSDKCYRNWNEGRSFSENDPMGGNDPYSASKGCAELISAAYSRAFFQPPEDCGQQRILIATARSGNVIGGGDWGRHRLLPDVVKAAAGGKVAQIRHPEAVRPWQHVLEALSGYLLLGQRLLNGDIQASGAWNFGPSAGNDIQVGRLLEMVQNQWHAVQFRVDENRPAFTEARILRIDSAKAKRELGWDPVWDAAEAVEKTVEWYRAFYEDGRVISNDQLDSYTYRAKEAGSVWTL